MWILVAERKLHFMHNGQRWCKVVQVFIVVFLETAALLTVCCSSLILQTERQLDCALDLMRRLPPQQIEKNLSDLIDLVSTYPCDISSQLCHFALLIAEDDLFSVCATI